MAISPSDGQKYARSIRALYEKSEQDLLEKIARRVARGLNTDPDTKHWLDAKLKEVRRSMSEIDRVLAKLSKDGTKAIQNLTIQGYISGMISADSDLSVYDVPMSAKPLKIPAGNVDPAGIVGSFGTMHTAAINALVGASSGGIINAHTQILRSSKDAYRNVITDILGSAVGGVDTRQQATQKALNKFADTGIGYFKDKNGKKWDLSTYAEMATRTGMAHAHIEGHVNRMVEQGYDLVIVSDHPEESPLCRPHEGKVYSVKEGHPVYPSLNWAIANGLFHPNCRHTINAYIEGLTEPPHTTGDPKGYEIRKHHRELERKVKFWKKREIVAVTDKEKRLAHQKVKHWQGELRSFTAETGRRRMYTREQVHLATFKLVDKDASKLIKTAADDIPKTVSDYAMISTDGRNFIGLLRGTSNKELFREFTQIMDDLKDVAGLGTTARLNAAREIFRGDKILNDFKPKAVDVEVSKLSPTISEPKWDPDNTKLSRGLWAENNKGIKLSSISGMQPKELKDTLDSDMYERFDDLGIASRFASVFQYTDATALDKIYSSHVTMEGIAHAYNPDPNLYKVRFVKFTARDHGNGNDLYSSDFSLVIEDKFDETKVGTISRTIIRRGDNFTVKNDYFELEPEYQGSGIATSVYFKQEQMVKKMANGRPINIKIHANLNVGAYAWSRHGFDFNDNSTRVELRKEVEKQIWKYLEDEISKPDVTSKKITDLFEGMLNRMGYNSLDDIIYPWQFAALDDGNNHKLPYNFEGTGHFGKALMLHFNDWLGLKKLNQGHDGEEIGNLYYQSKGVE